MRIAWERHGSGEPLLLIHGLGYARWGWEPVVEPLEQSFDVILFDNRGIGESDAPPGPYTVAELSADAVQVLDEAGVERAHVLGTSLGGMVAQELALAAPERVDKLVLACTTPGGTESFPMPEQTVKLLTSGATLRQFVENALAPEPDPEVVERILRHREATAQPPEAWSAQAAAGIGLQCSRSRRGDRRADARPPRDGRCRRGLPERRPARAPDPGRPRRAVPGRGPPLLLGAARALRRGRDGVPSRRRLDGAARERKCRLWGGVT